MEKVRNESYKAVPPPFTYKPYKRTRKDRKKKRQDKEGKRHEEYLDFTNNNNSVTSATCGNMTEKVEKKNLELKFARSENKRLCSNDASPERKRHYPGPFNSSPQMLNEDVISCEGNPLLRSSCSQETHEIFNDQSKVSDIFTTTGRNQCIDQNNPTGTKSQDQQKDEEQKKINEKLLHDLIRLSTRIAYGRSKNITNETNSSIPQNNQNYMNNYIGPSTSSQALNSNNQNENEETSYTLTGPPENEKGASKGNSYPYRKRKSHQISSRYSSSHHQAKNRKETHTHANSTSYSSKQVCKVEDLTVSETKNSPDTTVRPATYNIWAKDKGMDLLSDGDGPWTWQQMILYERDLFNYQNDEEDCKYHIYPVCD